MRKTISTFKEIFWVLKNHGDLTTFLNETLFFPVLNKILFPWEIQLLSSGIAGPDHRSNQFLWAALVKNALGKQDLLPTFFYTTRLNLFYNRKRPNSFWLYMQATSWIPEESFFFFFEVEQYCNFFATLHINNLYVLHKMILGCSR